MNENLDGFEFVWVIALVSRRLEAYVLFYAKNAFNLNKDEFITKLKDYPSHVNESDLDWVEKLAWAEEA